MVNHILGNLCATKTNSDLHFFFLGIIRVLCISKYEGED